MCEVPMSGMSRYIGIGRNVERLPDFESYLLDHQLSQKVKLLGNGPNNVYQAIQ